MKNNHRHQHPKESQYNHHKQQQQQQQQQQHNNDPQLLQQTNMPPLPDTPSKHKRMSNGLITSGIGGLSATMTLSPLSRFTTTATAASTSSAASSKSRNRKRMIMTCIIVILSIFIVLLINVDYNKDIQNIVTISNTNKNQHTFPNSSSPSWTPFNTTNPHQSTFCPTATCLNSPLCTPCNRRYIIILSTARSGSTTLLSMFNNLPQTRIAGENHNTFGITSQIESNLQHHAPQLLKHPMDKTNGPFRHNTIPKGSLSCITQHLHYVMNPPPLSIQQSIHTKSYQQEYKGNSQLSSSFDQYRILGFKTVRLHLFQSPFTAVKFYKQHFPCSKFIINVQYNITHQYESYRNTFHGTFKNTSKKNSSLNKKNMSNNGTDTMQEVVVEEEDKENKEDEVETTKTYNGPSKADLTKIRDFHLKAHQLFNANYNKNNNNNNHYEYAKLLKFDEWINDVTILNDVVKWLGYTNCHFNAIAHENENGYGVDNETKLDLGPNCHYPYLQE